MSPSAPLHYVLVDGKPVPEPDFLAWCEFMEKKELRFLQQDFFVYRERTLVRITGETYHEAIVSDARKGEGGEQKKRFELAKEKRLALRGQPIKVSTIFTGVNTNPMPDEPPILWETMVFAAGRAADRWQFTSSEAALDTHEIILGLMTRQAARGDLDLLADGVVSDESRQPKETPS